ncbi:MAG TPA: Flp pilus assembly protein CpaB [Candidatus Binataceae bacterium]|nr:Flp pilus assembly protein CpaB [Candidatus Binataceae bacterium]
MKRPIGFFLLSGIAAMLAALVVYSALKQREAAIAHATAQSVNIVVAARALPLGAKIDAHAVKLVKWSRDSVPPGSYNDPAALNGAYVKDAFVENEPMVATKLFMGQKSSGVMPLLIPPGMRAMSVPVDKVSDVAGFVQPRTRVDVVVAMENTGATNQKPFSKTVLENVEVLAVNQEIQGDPAKPEVVEVVTLMVTPEDAERLALASREGGNLRLAIRSYDDAKVVLTKGANIQDLLHVYSPAGPPLLQSQNVARRSMAAVQRPTVGVQIYRNGKSRESVSFIEAAGEAIVAPGRTAHREHSAAVAKTRSTARRGKSAPSPALADRKPPALDAAIGGLSAFGAAATPGGAISATMPGDAPAAPADFVATPKTIDVP